MEPNSQLPPKDDNRGSANSSEPMTSFSANPRRMGGGRKFVPVEVGELVPSNDKRPRRPRKPMMRRPMQDRPRDEGRKLHAVVPLKSATSAGPQLIAKAGTPGIRIVFLGGLGDVRIGKNMMALECGNDIIIVDCGIGFPTDDMLGIDLVIPDTRYLEERKQFVRGYFFTHGHEDHISGLRYVWPKIPAPVYGTRLTLGFLKAKLEEVGLDQRIEMRQFEAGDRIQVGPFNIEPVRVNHAIPDGVGLAIRTPEGLIINTGDWKIDHTPVSGQGIDLKRFAELGKEGVLLLMSDSTGVIHSGYTMSEREIYKSLEAIFAKAPGRIIIGSFASQVDRMQLIFDTVSKFGRKLAITGRSMERNANIALKYGYLRIPEGMIVDARTIDKYPDDKIVVLATGSQGEQYSALARMASGDHKFVKIKAGDTVIFSSSVVPGNENPVSATINNLYREGADVYRGKDFDLHVSGHASEEELKLMFALTRPKYFVPIHGQFDHLIKHARLAHKMGIDPKNIFVAEDGDFIEIQNSQARLVQNKIETNYILVDGSGVGDVGNIVLRDRQAMSKEGIFAVVMTVDHKTGKLMTSPDIISRGFVYMRASEELIYKARQEVKNIFLRHNERYPFSADQIKRAVREELGNFLFEKTQRQPMIIPVVIEV